jgi:regulation of enolase protein 1 (concanavalin A-like superfamily)
MMGTKLLAATHGRGVYTLDLGGTSQPIATVAPNPIQFGSQPVGSRSAGVTATIANTGTGMLNVTSVAIGGTNAAEFAVASDGCSGRSIGPASQCGVSITFTPGAAGTRQATLAIGSNAASTPTQVAIAGSGVATAAPPAPWSTADVGAVGIAGSASSANGTFTVTGAGADIWGTADAFRFVYQTMSGDGQIVARVGSISGAQAWTKAGVMIRQSLDAGSAHAFMLASKAKGLAFQRRQTAGAISVSTAGPLSTAPMYVRLVRAGQLVTASWSADGAAWTTIGQDTIALSGSVLVGLAITSHTTTATASAMFDHVAVAPAVPPLPASWTARDVGAVGVAGSSTSNSGTFTVKGAGADIWGTADAFQFASTSLTGDGSIVARVATVSGTQAWTKAGVMMRATADAGSTHAFMLVSTAKGLAFQRRTVAGGVSTSTAAGTGTAPRWVKLTRTGQTVTASVSTDGVTWTVAGTQTMTLPQTIVVGLAVTSHDATSLATATFDHVTTSP